MRHSGAFEGMRLKQAGVSRIERAAILIMTKAYPISVLRGRTIWLAGVLSA
jgi:hypothetical protein